MNGLVLPVAAFCMFVVFKLLGILTWPWFWVFTPIWLAIALGLITGVYVEVIKRIDAK